MESQGTPPAHQETPQEKRSPSSEVRAGHDAVRRVPSAASSPSTASSICSTTQLINYGADMNRDFAAITLLEEKLGREVEHEELKSAIADFRLVHGQLPSIRQLALELASHVEGHCSGGGAPESPAGPGTSPNEPQPSKPLRAHNDLHASPCRVLRGDVPLLSSPPRAQLCSGTQFGSLSHDMLARLCSPGVQSHQSSGRFSAIDSTATRTPLGLSSRCQPPTGYFLAVEQPCVPAGGTSTDASGDTEMVPAEAVKQQPAPRPFVPGLNLRGLNKKSPTPRGGPSPLTTDTTVSAAPQIHATSTSGSGRRTPDACSPTEILRMLLPSACKPRSVAAGAPARVWSSVHAPAGPLLPDQASADRVAASDAAARPRDVRQMSSLRVSMDDLDQIPTGQRRLTPVKAAPHAAADAGTDATPTLTRHKANPVAPGSGFEKHQRMALRVRRLHLQDQNDQYAAGHKTPRCRLLLLPEQPLGDNGSSAVADGGEATCSLVDSDLRKDTPSKDGVATAAAAVAVDCLTDGDAVVTVHCTRPEPSSLCEPTAPEDDDDDNYVPASRGGARGLSQAALQLAAINNPVPPLLLPAAASGHVVTPPSFVSVAGAARLSVRQRPWTTSSMPPPGLPSACAPAPPWPLPGGGHRQQQLAAVAAAATAGARTRRLSICVPSAMLYGEGPLTTRRMAAGANTGVTSHALCTVFWAESDEEIDPSDEGEDSDAYDTDELDGDVERASKGMVHAEGCDVPPTTDDSVLVGCDAAPDTAAASQSSTATAAAAAAAAALDPLAGASGPGSQVAAVRSDRQRLRRTSQSRRWRQGSKARRGGSDADNVEPDCCGGGLMLPEQLWDAWERLSDGPKGRQYRLLESLTHVERITCTSYSTVSKACHQGQPVVVKIYDVAERDKLANAFAEIGVLLHLSGWAGAVRLLDYGRHEDKVMLMLESCDHSLKDWCDSQRFEAATGAEYIAQVLRLWSTLAELLTELHERWHVAHCDLKPGNVLLSGGRLRLADFSESMLFHETPILQDQARGTVPYQPPEMVHDHCVDARKADVWAMGCILYEMITGELLFRGNNDCLRAVAAGAAATRVRQQAAAHKHSHRRSARGGRAAGVGASGGGASNQQAFWAQRPVQQQDQEEPLPQHHGGVVMGAAAAAAAVLYPLQLNAEQASPSAWAQGDGAGPWPVAMTEVPEPGEEVAAVVAASETSPPRVPRLPLALTHGQGVPGSPWRYPPLVAPAASLPPLPPLALPMHYFTGPGTGSAMVTGRSLELIAEGCGAEDTSSLVSDPWVAISVGNTAPTTARSTARSQMPYEHDTARSVASTSTVAVGAAGYWPPAPPPSTGTARSVADSEWTLAANTTANTAAAVTTAAAGVGASYGGAARPSCPGAGPTSRSAGGSHCTGDADSQRGDVAAAAPAAVTAEPPPLLPPYRRLRHSVATQCADPAGPDWLTTEEADRLRIMCDEPPSFILVHGHGGGSGSSSGDASGSGRAAAGRSNVNDGSVGDGDESMADVAAELRNLYKPRPLSGADGPSLCDSVLGLLRTVLVEDHVRPSMRQVAALAVMVLQRHWPQQPTPGHEPPVSGALAFSEVVLDDAAANTADTPSSIAANADLDFLEGGVGAALVGLHAAAAAVTASQSGSGLGVAGCGAAAATVAAYAAWHYGFRALQCCRPTGRALPLSVEDSAADNERGGSGSARLQDQAQTTMVMAALPQQLCLSVLREPRQSSSYDGGNNNASAAGRGGCGTDGGSWADSSSVVDDLVTTDFGSSGGGAVAATLSVPGVPGLRSRSLFDTCQPLLTSRGVRPTSRSWQRVLAKPE